MSSKIVIPTLDGKGVNSRLSPHFGRAPFFTLVELDDKGETVAIRAIPNTGGHFGGHGRPASIILELKPDSVITYGMGRRAIDLFQEARVAVLRANSDLVNEVIRAYNNDQLEELTEGCRHARHK